MYLVDKVPGGGPTLQQTPTISTSVLTTPDAVSLQSQWRQWADLGLGHVAMEASSIGLEEHRLAGTQVEMALFTNFTRDHLDYHGTMERYWAAKCRLFEGPLQAAGINIDDSHGAQLAQTLRTRGLDLWTVSSGSPGAEHARLRAADIVPAQGGTQFVLHERDELDGPSGHHREIQTWAPVVGTFNVNNLLLVLAALRHGGVPLEDALASLAKSPAVPGRLQRVNQEPNEPQVFVDFAHTPDALEKVLRTLQPLARASGGRLWCVFGCGGQRDRGKRPLMARSAASWAQCLVLTSDNPRQESPTDIINDITQGLPAGYSVQVQQITDRAEAIFWALAQAQAEDVVLIAGKGHETTQEIAGVRHPFNDVEVAQRALMERSVARSFTTPSP
jgi:UDP-N-acetylmuramoyl-L-alanyl-D-glutamate--2,6-diaminopimelate ligase